MQLSYSSNLSILAHPISQVMVNADAFVYAHGERLRATAGKSLVFIDRAVPDYEFLQAGVVDGSLVILLDVDRDGVSQITEELGRHRNVAAVHLVSHGVPGGIRLGNIELGLDSIDQYAAELMQWSEALAPQADLVIYGCEVAQGAGATLVWRLSELTGARVAASTTKTGCAEQGGDWCLNVTTAGQVPVLAFAVDTLRTYQGVLPNEPYLVADINKNSYGSNPRNFVNVSGTVFFVADNDASGTELWRIDPLTGVASIVDINSGTGSSNPTNLISVGGFLYLQAYDVANGNELRRVDTDGTVTTFNLYVGAGSFGATSLTNVNGKLYFTTVGYNGGDYNGTYTGYELWKIDHNVNSGNPVVIDIAGGAADSYPSNLINAGGTLYFVAYNSASGAELWKLSANDAPIFVRDINPGTGSSSPGNLTYSNGKLYFTADNNTQGVELWVTDGTADGTKLTTDINTNTYGSNPRSFINVNGTVFFVADNDASGTELWRIDPSTGIASIVEINPGSGASNPTNLISVGGSLYLQAYDVANGNELRKVTADGTVTTFDLYAGTNSFGATNLTNVNEKLYFTTLGYNGADYAGTYTGYELWKIDPSVNSGNPVVIDINVGPDSSYPYNLIGAGGTVYFVAYSVASGSELWKLGADDVPIFVKDVYPGASGSSIGNLTVSNGFLYFTAQNGLDGIELWRTSLANDTTVQLDIRIGANGSNPNSLIDVNGTLYFVANDGVHGNQLWKVDTTTGNPVLLEIADSNPVPGYISIRSLTNMGGRLYIDTYNGYYGNSSLYMIDSVTNLPVALADLGNVSNITNINGTLYFSAYSISNNTGYELWKIDPVSNTPTLIEVNPDGSSSPSNFTLVNSTLFFTANNATSGTELWKLDASGSPVLVKDIRLNGSSSPSNLFSAGNKLYFAVDDGTHGLEIWQSDGTEAGTVLAKDINEKTLSSNPNSLVDINGTLYFVADDGIHGNQLWKVDLTTGNPVLLEITDSNPVPGYISIRSLTNVGGRLYIGTYNGYYGNSSLYTIDSVTNLPVAVADLGNVSNITNINGTLYFSAYSISNNTGYELWKIDPANNTPTLIEVNPGGGSSSPSNFTLVNGTLFFTANNETSGTELWKLDASGNPVLVKDIRLIGSSSPSNLFSAGNKLYFAVDDGTHGLELWQSDGTEAGTVIAKDINDKTLSSSPNSLIDVNGTLYFVANDGVHGNQLWKVDATTGNPVLLEITDSNPVPGYISIRSLTNVGGRLYVDTYNGYYGNSSLYTIDAVTNLPVVVGDLRNIGNFTNINGILYFSAYSSTYTEGYEIWKIDPASNTPTLIDINPGGGSSSPSNFTLVNGTLFFAANNETSGTELWKLDAAGNPVLIDINPGGSSSPSNLIDVNGTLFFVANNDTSSRELWKILPTDTAATLIDIYPGINASNPSNLINVNGTLFFVADDGTSGTELWKISPTDAAATLIDSYPGINASNPSNLIDVNGILFFIANNDTSGRELWRISPTDATATLIDLYANGNSSSPDNLTNVNGTLYFTAYNYNTYTGYDLWKISPNTISPVLIDIAVGNDSSPRNLLNVNGTLYFTASNPASGLELWQLDATGNPVRLSDIQAGSASSSPGNLTYSNGKLYFTADNATQGVELWAIDVNSVTVSGNITKSAAEDNSITFAATDFSSVFTGGTLNKIKISALPSNGLLKLGDNNIVVNQEISLTDLDNLRLIPNNNFNGTVGFTWNGSDGTTYSLNPATANLSFSPVNDAPQILNPISDRSSYTGNPLNFGIPNSFQDVDFGDTLIITATLTDGTALPSWLTFSAGNFSGTAPQGSAGTYEIKVTAKDSSNLTATDNFIFTILEGAPYSIDLSPFTVAENSANNTVIGNLSSLDPNAGETFTYTLLNDAGGRFTIVGNQLRVANSSLLDFENLQQHIIRVLTTDSTNLTYERDIAVNVSNVNDTNPGTLSFSAANYSVNEDGTPVSIITVQRTGGSEGYVNASILLSNGTATSPTDYNPTILIVNFANGETTKTIAVPVLNDSLTETNETVNLTLANPQGGAVLGTQTTAVLTIVDNDPLLPSTLAFDNGSYSVNENGVSSVTVLRTGGINGVVSVNILPADGTATFPDDYSDSPITVTFSEGEISKNVTIPIVNDGKFEFYETVNLKLSNPTGGANLGVVDTAKLVISPNFTLNGAAKQATSFDNTAPVLRLTDGLGQSGSAFLTDRISLNNQASFSTSFQFQISSPQGGGDEDGQGADGLAFVIQTVANNVGGAGGGIGYAGINNSLGIEFDTYNNGGVDDNSGNHIGIDINGNIDSVVTQSIPTRLNDGNIWTAWIDYNGASDLLEVRLSSTNQRPDNALLSYQIDLAATLQSTDAFIGFTSGTGGAGGVHDILNWDFKTTYQPISAGKINFSSPIYTIGENGESTAAITVSRTGGNNGAVSAVILLNDGTALSGSDYINNPITVSFADGETSKVVTLSSLIINDTTYEQTENLTITLSTPTGGATIGTQSISSLNIIDNDAVPGIVQFSAATYSVNEDGTTVAAITLTRTGGIDGAVSVRVDLSNGSATAPNDYFNNSIVVNFANGENSKTVTIPILDDAVIEATETINLALSDPSGGVAIGTQNTTVLNIIDNDLKPTLTIEIAPQTNENSGAISGTVTRNTGLGSDLVVNLINSDSGQISVPATVTILAGQTAANFNVGIINDTLIEANKSYSITSAAPGFISAVDTFQIIDDDAVNLTVSLATSSISEDAGKTTVTVTRNVVTDTALVVQLTGNSNVTLPGQVTIGANQSTATFEVDAVNDALLNGNRTVAITAKPTYTGTTVVTPTGSGTANLTVVDDETASLKLSIDKDIIAEGATATVTVTRNSDTTNELVVNLASSDDTQATTPSTVTILAGQTTATFAVTGVNDGVNDGSKSVTLTASATGLNSGTDVLEITDVNIPDLFVKQLAGVQPVYTSKQSQFTYEVINNGISTASGAWKDKVYLSKDNKLDAQDTLLGEFGTGSATTPANLLPGLSYSRTVTYFTPRTPGDYYLIATTDSGNTVVEGTGIAENNNTSIAPLTVTAAYRGVVNTAVNNAVAGTTITLNGQALSNINNAPVPYEFVTIAVKNQASGAVREISAFTNGSGDFVSSFTPLPNEGGQYEINAYFPGNKTEDAAPEDTFKILGMQFTTAGVTQKVISDSTFSGTLSLKNLTDIPLTGITATVLGAPADWTVQVTAPATLAGDAANSIGYTITAPNSSTTTFDKFGIQLTSSEGATTTIPLDITLERTIPRLVASPTALTSGMLRGGQTFVNFQITNEGGAATGDIDVLTPANTPWLKLTSPGKISSLAPGQSTTLTALLTPDASLSLTQYQGSLFFDVAGNDGDLSLPFNFRAVSTATGNVRVDVSDELTYFQAGAPHLQGAKVVLRDYFTNEIVRETVTDSNGLVDWADVAEGPYKLEVTADKHDTYRQTIQIDAGESENINSFLSRQTVRYTWNVTPTEIEDKYIIKIESTFETNVPIPTVTIDPPSIDFGELQSIGQIMQIEMTVTNHGLIAADNVNLGFGTHPFYKIEPLIDSIDLLSAKSSVTVPVRITRIADFDPGASSELSAQSATDVPCQISAGISYSYECAGQEIKRAVPIPIFNVEGNCSPLIIGGQLPFYNILPNLQFSGPGGDELVRITPVDISVSPSNCDPCVEKIKQEIIKCALDLIGIKEIIKCVPSIGSSSVSASVENDNYALEFNRTVGSPPSSGGFFGCLKGFVVKKIKTPIYALKCIKSIITACAGSSGGAGPSSSDIAVFSGIDRPFNIEDLEEQASRLEVINEIFVNPFGDKVWIEGEDPEILNNWLDAFLPKTQGLNNTNLKISESQRDELLQLPLPELVTGSDVNKFIDRWNRSVDYWNAGIFDLADVPQGENTDFIALDLWEQALAKANEANDLSKAKGFDDLGAEFSASYTELKKSVDGSNGVCAKVKISIDQEAVMTRSAFLGSLEISNGNETSLNNISVALEVRNQNGVIVNDIFGITQPILLGISAVDGTGILTGNNPTTPIDEGFGSAKWTFIPTNLAAPEVPTQYTIGGKLSYTENGKQVIVPLIAAPITVLPQAELYLDYFQQRNVYADDPFTDDIVETSVPFALGVLVRNEGKGDAKNLRITSSQPKIVENKKGLLVDFEIIGSQVNGTGVSPSLAVNFGDIAAGKTAVADWQLKSSIQGKFTDYKATFEHVNGLGKKELSLIKDVKIHELIHQVKADRPTGDDNLPDFLVNEVFDANFTPDTIYFSNGGTATVAFAGGTADAPITVSDKVAQITATTTPGWSYIKLTDPGDGKYQVKSVVRSDGKVIKTDNVWLTDRTFPGTGRPTYENILHLLDFDSTGSYTITYSSGDTIAPTADIIDVSPDPRTTAVGSIDVTFSEAIQGSTFDYQDLNLTLNGGANLITSAITVALVSDTTYRITGLDTSNDGQYQLSLITNGITDLDGNAGTTTATETWTKAADAPAVLAINGIINPLRNTPVTSLEVAFSQDINASSLSISDLSLTLNGGANLLTASNNITAISGNTYQIDNIQGLTGNPGNYVFSVNATGVQNVAGNAGIGNRSVNWQLDNVQPTVQSISGVTSTSRRQPLQQVEVTFSESIDITTLTASDIVLTRDGVAVALSGLDITSSGNGKYLIKGLAAAQTGDGNYQLTVNGGGVSDVAGNAGTGSAAVSWSTDTLAPSASGITISPDTGISSTDLLTNSLNLTVAGTTSEAGAQVSLKDLTTGIDLSSATSPGTTFSQNIVLNNPGTHQIQVHVVDAAGNFTDSNVNVFVDQAAPTSSFVNVPSTNTSGISSIDIAFSESIDVGSLTLSDLKLTKDGVLLDLSDAVITAISGTNYQLSGLSALTATPGNYSLFLNNVGVIDRAGNAGTDSTVANFTVTPPATPGIKIVQSGGSTTVAEGGVSDSYTIVLNTQPTADVVVNIAANNQLTTNKQTLTFTANNWNIGQDVSITAVDDVITQSDRLVNIAHTVSSNDSGYSGIVAPTLNASVRDNDAEIRGFVWQDLDGNGQKNGAEINLAGRTVYLDSNNNGQVDASERTTITNSSGEYTFNDLRPGSYTVAQVLPVGWSQTAPIINVSTSASNESLYVPSEAALSTTVAGISATSATLTNFQSFQADPNFANIKGQGSSTVIIDTGADLDSSFFGGDTDGNGVADRIIYQHDFADNDNDASDRTGHGSHVASIAAQLAPSANLIILKVFKDSGTGSFADLEKALQWVNQNTATYNIASVNLSLGDSQNWNTTNPRYGIGDEIAAISAQNVIIAAAAGNNFYRFNSAPGVAYPAADPNTIAVGAVWAGNFGGTQSFSSGAKDYNTDADRIASFSQRDANLLDVFAPGVFISGANATGGTQSLGGTSQATPFVSGIAVLAQQIASEKLGRKLTVAEFRQLLDSTSTIIKDGDNENDNVVNTGASYPRIDLLNLAKGVANFSGSSTTGDSSNPNVNGGGSPTVSGSQILTHLVTVAAGQIVVDKNFGSLQDLNRAKNDFGGDRKSDILWRNIDGRVVTWQMDGSTVLSDTFIERPAPLDWQVAGTGDFNGDNKSDILWRNIDGRVVIWRMDGSTVLSDTFIERPAPLDWQIAGTGDFNGDNKSDILWRNIDGRVVIWRMDGSTVLSDTFIDKPAPLDWQIAGTADFNGDNKSDILWRNKDGRVVIWQMDGSTVLSDTFIDKPATLDWQIASTGDFNGDNKSDILWRNKDGRVVIWQMDGFMVLSDTFIDKPATLDWQIADTRDFNGDGKSDILWRNDDGRVVTWQMDGSTVLSDTFIERPAPLDWQIEISNVNPVVNRFKTVANDFGKDYKSDILWRNDDGRVVLWQMDGSTVLSDTFIERPAPLDWQIAGTGDFDGDAQADIVWRNINGRVVIWRMDGSTVLSDSFIERPAPLDWQIAGTGDFNGDNKSDILWRNKDGRVVIWRMDGSTVLSDSFIDKPATLDWQIAGTGDFNGDDKSDILWRNKDGHIVIWQMDGSTVLSDSFIERPAPLDWQIAGTGDFNGDNKSDILWRNKDGRVVIWQMDGSTVLSDTFIDKPATLDWQIADTKDFNGDGKSDILWRNTDGRVVTWQMDGSTVLSDNFIERPASLDWQIEISNLNPVVNRFKTVANDFGKDYKSDILWRNDDGRVVIWQMDDSTVLSDNFIERPAPLDWKITGTGDFDGDAQADILWRNVDDGRVVIWRMDGSTVLSDTFIDRPASLDWQIAGTGDFNGDNKSDILWRNIDGQVVIWQMDGSTILSDSFTTIVATNDWQIAGTGDFNGDSKSDILWRNTDGRVQIWQMDGATVVADLAVRAVGTDWLIKGVDDFNGDGKSDILWHNTNSGSTYIYQMDGALVTNEGEIASNDLSIAGTGDFNGDSKADILWRNSDGSTSVWTMNGFDRLGEKDIRQVDNSWKIFASI
jgi:ELWxxDGT repeat protein